MISIRNHFDRKVKNILLYRCYFLDKKCVFFANCAFFMTK